LHPLLLFVRIRCCYQVTDRGGIRFCFYHDKYIQVHPSIYHDQVPLLFLFCRHRLGRALLLCSLLLMTVFDSFHTRTTTARSNDDPTTITMFLVRRFSSVSTSDNDNNMVLFLFPLSSLSIELIQFCLSNEEDCPNASATLVSLSNVLILLFPFRQFY